MQWKLSPRIKIYEALGAIGDGRIEMSGNSAKVYSSSRNKAYDVVFDEQTRTISANDNGSYWQGYVGYPAISYLMLHGTIAYNPQWTEFLKGFAWKEINTRFNNDFDKTAAYIREVLVEKFGVDLREFDAELDRIETQLQELALFMPKKRVPPPKG